MKKHLFFISIWTVFFTQAYAIEFSGSAQTAEDICARMLKPPAHSELAYKTRFVLEMKGDFQTSLQHLKMLFYEWTVKSYPDIRNIPFSEFEAGTILSQNDTDIVIKSIPGHWAMAIEKTNQHAARSWRTDVAISLIPEKNQVIFHLKTISWLTSVHAQNQIEHKVPLAIRALVEDKSHWNVTTDKIIVPKGNALTLGSNNDDINLFKKILMSSGQRLPIVYISYDPWMNGYAVHPDLLAKELLGLAVVIKEEGLETQRRLRQILPESHRVWNGAVRIYMPEVDLNNPRDNFRHRYYKSGVITDMGLTAFTNELYSVIMTWQEQVRRPNEITTLMDLANFEMEQLANKLKEQYTSMQQQGDDQNVYVELLKIMETEQQQLREEIKRLQNDLDISFISWQEALQQLDELKSKKLEYTPSTSYNNGKRSDEKLNQTSQKSAGFIRRLPKTILEVVQIFNESFSGRLVFTKEAFESAEKTSFSDVNVTWKILYEMGTTLHKLYFENNTNPNIIPGTFHSQTGLELSPNEGEYVASHSRLRRLREFFYDGKTVFMAAHVKYGNRAPKLIRVHYYVDREKKLIVIGHVGDHLENGATKHQ